MPGMINGNLPSLDVGGVRWVVGSAALVQRMAPACPSPCVQVPVLRHCCGTWQGLSIANFRRPGPAADSGHAWQQACV